MLYEPFFDERVADWVADRIPECSGGFSGCQALGVMRGDTLVAGVVYHDWSPEFGVIEISGASEDKRWLTRNVVHTLLAYPFDFCQMVVARHAPDGPARRLWTAVGADEYEIPNLRGDGKSGIIATLTRKAWQGSKWCRNGQKK